MYSHTQTQSGGGLGSTVERVLLQAQEPPPCLLHSLKKIKGTRALTVLLGPSGIGKSTQMAAYAAMMRCDKSTVCASHFIGKESSRLIDLVHGIAHQLGEEVPHNPRALKRAYHKVLRDLCGSGKRVVLVIDGIDGLSEVVPTDGSLKEIKERD